MNLERIMSAVRDLEVIIMEETGHARPIKKIGVSAEFYDILMCEYISKSMQGMSMSQIYHSNINGIEYVPIKSDNFSESNTKTQRNPKKTKDKLQHDNTTENNGKIVVKTLFDVDYFDDGN